MSDVTKRCKCGEAKINKCGDPWYMKNFIWQGVKYADNVTRWAEVFEPTEPAPTTRTAADAVCVRMRAAITQGTYVKAKVASKARPKLATDLTLAQLVAAFDRDVLSVQIADDDAVTDETLETHRSRLARLVGFAGYGDRPATALDAAALIAFRTSPAIRVLGRSSWAKHRGIYNRLFRYAKHAGVMTVNPFEAVSEEQHAVLRRKKSEPRSRRLKVGEEDRLLRAALGGRFKFDAQRTHDLIVAALECAGRLGELLAIKWADVDLAEAPAVGVITIRGEEKGAGKTGARLVPISDRLRAVLVRRRVNALTGQPYRDGEYVFGNEVGEKLKQLGSWESTVVRASGQTPETVTGGNLSTTSRAAYKAANLHFHDLRRECASRWLDSGAFELHEIRDLLGHSNIAQTSEYLAVKAGSVLDAMRRFNAQRAAAAVLPLAVGATDHKPTTNGAEPVAAAPSLALVKGNKSHA